MRLIVRREITVVKTHRRAARGGFVRRELEAMLNETGDPDALFSARGLLRAVVSG